MFKKIANEENQVKKILIVGNGYDLACGLKSKFSDFFNPLLARFVFLVQKKNEINSQFEELSNYYYAVFYNFIKKFDYKTPLKKEELVFFESDFSKLLIKKFYPHVWVLIKCCYSEKINVIFNNSPFLPFLNNNACSENNSSEDTSLSQILDKFCKKVSLLDNSDVSWLDVENVITSIVKEECIQPLPCLMTEDELNDFNDALNKYEKGYIYQLPYPSLLNNNKSIDYKISSCLEGLNLFKKLFIKYLINQQSCYLDDKKRNKLPLNQKYNNVISLNYTELFKQSLVSPIEDNICYIHGKLEKNNIVIGTESFYFSENSRDDTNITNVPFFKFFQRVLNKTDDKYLSWINGSELFSLTFFGFSFSQNDFDLIRELVVMDDKGVRPNLQNITIYCYKKTDKYNFLVNLATCLGKKVLLSVKNKLDFIVLT